MSGAASLDPSDEPASPPCTNAVPSSGTATAGSTIAPFASTGGGSVAKPSVRRHCVGPLVLGVPILFGVLRKELSLLMIYQALGTLEISPLLDHVQIFTFLVFLTFYVPCLSTFAVMLKTLGKKEAWLSVMNSLVTALLMAGTIRVTLETARHFSTPWTT